MALVTNSREHFAFLRLSSPAAAFENLRHDFITTLEKDHDVAKAFASFQKHLKGKVNTAQDARQLAVLRAKGADKLGINVGALPLAISPGLVFMYDTAVELLRSGDKRVDPRMFNARAIQTIERLLDLVLLQIGSKSVTALELALADPGYADRLRLRANEMKVVAAVSQGSFGPCEHCQLVVEDAEGNVEVTCPSKEQCDSLGTYIFIAAVIWLASELLDWLF